MTAQEKSETYGIHIFTPYKQKMPAQCDFVLLVDSLAYTKGSKIRLYMQELLEYVQQNYSWFGVAVFSRGASLVTRHLWGTEYSTTYLEMLKKAPKSRVLILETAGNDFLSERSFGSIGGYLADVDMAVKKWAAMARQVSQVQMTVCGACAAIWGFKKEAAFQFDTHAERLRRTFLAERIHTVSGAHELLGINIKDCCGHVAPSSYDQLFNAWVKWIKMGMFLKPGAPAIMQPMPTIAGMMANQMMTGMMPNQMMMGVSTSMAMPKPMMLGMMSNQMMIQNTMSNKQGAKGGLGDQTSQAPTGVPGFGKGVAPKVPVVSEKKQDNEGRGQKRKVSESAPQWSHLIDAAKTGKSTETEWAPQWSHLIDAAKTAKSTETAKAIDAAKTSGSSSAAKKAKPAPPTGAPPPHLLASAKKDHASSAEEPTRVSPSIGSLPLGYEKQSSKLPPALLAGAKSAKPFGAARAPIAPQWSHIIDSSKAVQSAEAAETSKHNKAGAQEAAIPSPPTGSLPFGLDKQSSKLPPPQLVGAKPPKAAGANEMQTGGLLRKLLLDR